MAVIYTALFFVLLLTAVGIIIAAFFIITGIILLIIGIVKRKKYIKLAPSKRKKYPKVLIVVGSVLICIPLVLVGTAVTYSLTREKKLTTEEKCEIIINAVQNKEKEPIKELFCEKAKNTLDLDKELDGFFNFIDGNIVSYDKPMETSNEASSTREDGLVERHEGGRICNILTDKGNVYEIGIRSFYVDKENPGRVGIVLLGVTDVNRYNEENNYPKDSFYLIEIDVPD